VKRRPRRLRRYFAALLGAAACQACFAKEPAREAAPPAPPPPAAAPDPAPAAPVAPAEAPATEAVESAEPSRASGGAPEQKKTAPKVGRSRSAPVSGLRERREASEERDDSAADAEEAAPRKSKGSSAELLMQRLGTAENLGTPDCPSARDRKRAICDLAAQICRLVDNDPNVASVVEYCSDARKRCSDAEHRIAQRCE
jgi:hypothetical protein